jgi:hypothetical protein
MRVILHVLRTLRRLPPPKVTRDEAVQIALAEMRNRGSGPLQVAGARGPSASEGLRDWTILLEPDFRPCRRVVVDNQTGRVVKCISPAR